MTTLDVDRPVFRSPPSNKRSSFSSTSLNSLHISQAISQSPDNGATLMFSKLSLSDISVLAAEELASIGRETSEDESPVKRYDAFMNIYICAVLTPFELCQNCPWR